MAPLEQSLKIRLLALGPWGRLLPSSALLLSGGGGGGGFGVAVDLDYAEVDSWNKYLASVSEGVNEINWWNVETGERVACVSANPNDTMESMNSQPDLQEVWIEYV